jgi:hypothetical protein
MKVPTPEPVPPARLCIAKKPPNLSQCSTSHRTCQRPNVALLRLTTRPSVTPYTFFNGLPHRCAVRVVTKGPVVCSATLMAARPGRTVPPRARRASMLHRG